jgi:hypothetical protein
MSAIGGVKLYELADMRDVLSQWLEESEGEVTPELQELLDGLAGEVNEKIERTALFIREQLATADAVEQEADRLHDRVRALRKGADGLKGYLKLQLERLGTTKVTGLLATIALQKNSQPSVTTVLQPSELYAIDEARPFVKREETVVYTLERAAILAAFKAGEQLPAAIVVDQASHIRIR